MKCYYWVVIVFFLIFPIKVFSQSFGYIEGIVKDSTEILPNATIWIEELNQGTITNFEGYFKLKIPAKTPLRIKISYIAYHPQIFEIFVAENEIRSFEIQLISEENTLDEVSVEAYRNNLIQEVSVFKLDPKMLKKMPSAFGDFNKVLATLGPVVSNSELSSEYSVRGGNFDENLIYVNDIEIYRPFLIRAGQQEGLSFINPDLVEEIKFSAGGWEASYGDKLSSMLAIQYKKPQEWAGSLSLGILNSSGHIEGVFPKQNLSFIAGVRYKNAQYLLQTLPTQGEYLPRFLDIQSMLYWGISPKDSVQVLFSYAQNRYLLRPATRQTDFGTNFQSLRLTVGFDGQETMRYDLWQNALKYAHYWNEKSYSSLIFSWISTQEREYFDLESGYRLAEIAGNNNLLTIFNSREIATTLESGRNRLEANLYRIDLRNKFQLSENQVFEIGGRFAFENINDRVNEYTLIDSVGFITPQEAVQSRLSLNSQRFEGYFQHSFSWNAQHFLNYGLRASYWTSNEDWIISPRLQYSFIPNWKKDYIFKFAAGVYQQPPFYRELRDKQGNLQLDLPAQSSLHLILGAESDFTIAGRKFKWTAETYYKSLWNVIPYDIENVRIRYLSNQTANAFAYGFDFRVSGEFVKDAVSWFSLGIMNTQEDLSGDDIGYVRRPTDQRLTFAVYFEDYLPNQPTWRVNLHLLLGTGLPFSPPDLPEFRSAFNAPLYRRVDLGVSKMIIGERYFRSIWLGLEVLNVLATPNTISYTWVTDVNQQQYAVPNTLSQRFLNFRCIIEW